MANPWEYEKALWSWVELYSVWKLWSFWNAGLGSISADDPATYMTILRCSWELYKTTTLVLKVASLGVKLTWLHYIKQFSLPPRCLCEPLFSCISRNLGIWNNKPLLELLIAPQYLANSSLSLTHIDTYTHMHTHTYAHTHNCLEENCNINNTRILFKGHLIPENAQVLSWLVGAVVAVGRCN